MFCAVTGAYTQVRVLLTYAGAVVPPVAAGCLWLLQHICCCFL